VKAKIFCGLMSLCAVVYCSAVLQAAEPEPGLYLRTTYAFGNLALSTVYIAKGGKIAIDPKEGVDPFDFEAAAKKSPQSVGKFTVSGNKFLVTWSGKSKPQEVPVEFQNGQLSAYDGGLLTKAEAYEKDQRLNATYAGLGTTANVSASRTLTLTSDGKYTMKLLGGVRGIPGAAPGVAETTETGQYQLKGNTLTLTSAAGKSTKHTVLPFNTALDPKKAQLSDEHMIFDGLNLKREK
jgi:hypothetical protein